MNQLCRPPKVLVIDDDPAVRKVLVSAFERVGCQTRSAPDGRAGMKLFKSEPADLVVTDILMPNQEGIETILALKNSGQDPKVIAISGGGSRGGQDFLRWARNLGADATLPKPFRSSQLIHIARALLAADAPRWAPLRPSAPQAA
jgi:CheY-like chemotaxis protein